MTEKVKVWKNGQDEGNIDISKAFRHKKLEERAEEREEDFEPLEEIDWGESVGREI